MKYLTYKERKIIEKMLKEQASYRNIAVILKRSHTTISEEIKKNKMSYEKEYNAENAHRRFLKRQANKGKKPILELYPQIKTQIIEWLTKEQWSPEQMSGVLKLMYPKLKICHETIYKFIYSEEGKKLKLWLHLRHKKRPQRQSWGRKKRCKVIKYRVPISKRPKAANEKLEIGHLETDSMIFSGQKEILSVQVDRKTQKCSITLLPNKTALETKYALQKSIEEFGERHVKTITYDNGSENAKHYEINQEYGVQSYFCKPYASWQKGLVENINKLIRQYLPRYTNTKHLTQNIIYSIQEKLNNRPRKSLNYLTPNQVYSILAQGGRIKSRI